MGAVLIWGRVSEFQIVSGLICRTRADYAGQGRDGHDLRDLGSFGACDVLLVLFAERAEMLIAHKVSPFEFSRTIDNGSKRAEFSALLFLAAFRFGSLLFDAIERCGIFHVPNIAC